MSLASGILDLIDRIGDEFKAVYTALTGKSGSSYWNATTSMYEPVRDASARHWTYVQTVAGDPIEPTDTNGGAGRKHMDELIILPPPPEG